jgi:superfamily II DNA/RNA helicase
MRRRFRPKHNFRNNFRPLKPSQELLWAITAGREQNAPDAAENPTVYIPKHKFEDFSIESQLKNNIASKGYVKPTPIQDQSIPFILEGRDIIGIANTGTGKTAAFLVPLIDKVFKDKSQRVLIIAPTRELAVQIGDELRVFANGMGICSVLCIGGANIRKQRSELFRNPNFVIGTPGRIRDFINQRCLNLSQFANVVLDEADRMVDIGFINDIKFFISLLPKKRHSLFFSATISGKVKEIIEPFVTNPVTVSTKDGETAKNVKQEIIKVAGGKPRVDILHDLLIQENFSKVLIFGRTKRGVQKLTNELMVRGFKAGVIHGNKSQNQRQKALDMFRKNQIQILLATDVASRGLDIDDVSHVINYDMPASYDDYVHRIGRTGRADKAGVALTFVG